MAPSNFQDAEVPILKRIMADAKRMRDLYSRTYPSIIPQRPSSTASTALSITLPAPRDFTQTFIGLGCNASAASLLSKAYTDAGNRFKAETEARYRLTTQQLMQHRPSSSGVAAQLSAVCTSRYLRTLNDWELDIRERIRTRIAAIARQVTQRQFISHDADGRLRRTRKNRKATFNHAYVPTLELCFGENPYPTPHDKEWLAHTTGMTVRQITVWFQNRRNRSQKTTDYKGNRVIVRRKLTLADVEKETPEVIRPRPQRIIEDESEDEEIYYSDEDDVSEASLWPPRRDSTAKDVLDRPAPAYAFPTQYPPTFPDGHVKDLSGNFPAPVWDRRPATYPAPTSQVVDVNELLIKMGTFRLWPSRDQISYRRKKLPPCMRFGEKPARTSPPPKKPDQCAARRAITTIAPRAPLPSFIPKKLVPAVLAFTRRKAQAAMAMPPPSTVPGSKRSTPRRHRRSPSTSTSERSSSPESLFGVSPSPAPINLALPYSTEAERPVAPIPRRRKSRTPSAGASDTDPSPAFPPGLAGPSTEVPATSSSRSKKKRSGLPRRTPPPSSDSLMQFSASSSRTWSSSTSSSQSSQSTDRSWQSTDSAPATPPADFAAMLKTPHLPTALDYQLDFTEFLNPNIDQNYYLPTGIDPWTGHQPSFDLSSLMAQGPKSADILTFPPPSTPLGFSMALPS